MNAIIEYVQKNFTAIFLSCAFAWFNYQAYVNARKTTKSLITPIIKGRIVGVSQITEGTILKKSKYTILIYILFAICFSLYMTFSYSKDDKISAYINGMFPYSAYAVLTLVFVLIFFDSKYFERYRSN